MYIIIGATGHVGSAVANTLLKHNKEVIVITRSHEKAKHWETKGARAEVLDVEDVVKFRKVLQTGKKLFLLNPPAPPNTDIDFEERKTISAILEALEGSGIEKVVAESTYGAQPGKQIGDLGVLYEMEMGLKKLNISSCIIRAAYYMSNWDTSLESVQSEGRLYTFFPPQFKLPMVAPSDIGKIAASMLMDPEILPGIYYVEGPERYSAADVANAFSIALKKSVEPIEIPSESWIQVMKQVGFSDTAAISMSNMTSIVVNRKIELPAATIRGEKTLNEYIGELTQG